MRILTRNIAIREEQNWLETLKNAISDPKILLKTLNLPVEDFAEDIVARKLFAMRVPLPFVEKMEKGNPKDPLFLQVMTAQQEFIEAEGFSQDPLDEQQKMRCLIFCINTKIACCSWQKEAVPLTAAIVSVAIFLMIKTQAIKPVGNKQ